MIYQTDGAADKQEIMSEKSEWKDGGLRNNLQA